MQIAGSAFLFEQNNRLRDSLLDYSRKNSENVAASQNLPEAPKNQTPETIEAQSNERDTILNLSAQGRRGAYTHQWNRPESSVSQLQDFSTKAEPAQPAETAAAPVERNGNEVLNQYRFFVQSAQYSGAEGTVRRLS